MSEKKVLVVDDQKTFREAVAFEFEMLGYEQIMAENGQDAYEKYQNNDIDLIICDIRMPVWDGRKFLNELRKTSKTTPPFIFMTGFADLQPYQAFHEGADAFISKPIDPDSLVKTVERVMSPISERLQSAPETNPSIVVSVDAKDENQFSIGRLGFFLSAKNDAGISNLKTLDLVEFSVSCEFHPIKKLKGVGKIVWTRLDDADEPNPGVGVQVEYLTDDCRQVFLDYIDNNTTSISVPSGDNSPDKAA